MFKHFIAIICCVVFGIVLHAQDFTTTPEYLNANSKWAFGFGLGIDFGEENPIPLKSAIESSEGSASVADPIDGKLLFYSNGMAVWNANHDTMPNGWGLWGNNPATNFAGWAASCAQGVCIVPVIGVPSQYYLFSLGQGGQYRPLYYNVVDMKLDNGRGDIVGGKKNLLLDYDPLSECMIAIPGACDEIWLLVHHPQGSQFRAYRISNSGIDSIPVLSNSSLGKSYFASLAVSPDRNLIAAASIGGDLILAKFDPNSGIVSNEMAIDDKVPRPGSFAGFYGVCFSPDNTKLYATTSSGGVLSQFDVSNFNELTIRKSKTPIGTFGYWRSLKSYGGSIYLIGTSSPQALGSQSISVITQPNANGVLCKIKHDALQLSSGVSLRNIGNFGGIGNYVIPHRSYSVKDTTICRTRIQDSMLSISLEARSDYASFVWDDGSSLKQRIISKSGTYWITYMAPPPCIIRVDTFHVNFVNVFFSLGPDTVLCDREYYQLTVPVPNAEYLWQDGSTSATYTARGKGIHRVVVTKESCKASDDVYVSVSDFKQDLGRDTLLCNGQPLHIYLAANIPPGASVQWNNGSMDSLIVAKDTGIFWVTVTDLPCTGSDSVRISRMYCDCKLFIPNAFTPNGDGINDIFMPLVEVGCPSGYYSFKIFNRFGEMVFFSESLERGWDGTHKGQVVDVGTYFYQLNFTGGIGSKKKEYKQRGDLTLIR